MTPASARFLRSAFFVLALLVAVLLQWPMARLAAPRIATVLPGVAAEEVRGSLWSAQAIGVHMAGRRIPQVRLQVAPASLLRGDPRIVPAWPAEPDAATGNAPSRR